MICNNWTGSGLEAERRRDEQRIERRVRRVHLGPRLASEPGLSQLEVQVLPVFGPDVPPDPVERKRGSGHEREAEDPQIERLIRLRVDGLVHPEGNIANLDIRDCPVYTFDCGERTRT
jgi:hypothetical protein